MSSATKNLQATREGLPADLPERAIELAAELLAASRTFESSIDRKRSGQMARMMSDANGKKFTIVMTDQILKVEQPDRAAHRLQQLVQHYGLPRYLSRFDRFKLWAGTQLAQWLPRWVMPRINQEVRRQSQHVIVSAEPQRFQEYVRWRHQAGFRINLNLLGEAVLGDYEANRRLNYYLQRLDHSDINYVSVKLSSIVSQISLTGYRQSVQLIKERLRKIYQFARNNRSKQQKFVNLDMEEYRDLHLTVDVFRELLDEPEFDDLEAGIVLQAYLPDSFAVQQELTEWSRTRFQRTGSRIKVRLVKGANLAMEHAEAALRGWEQAPYHGKPDVDANYKRMLEYGTRPEHAEVVRIGVASHNLFDVAYALLLREARGVADQVEFEMLEGMANAQAQEVAQRSGGLVVYTPAVHDKEFESAVAYLVRRLDENTAPESFLGALFNLQVGSAAWMEQRDAFLKACRRASDSDLSSEPNRKQNRLTEKPLPRSATEAFENTPDTDFSLPPNRVWAEQIVARWQQKTIEPIPLEIGGQRVEREASGRGKDPSRPGVEAYHYTEATSDDVDAALDAAVAAQVEWERLGVTRRSEILRQVAAVFAQQRGDTIGAMMLDAGKAITEGDVEVSEAIDFANYYAQSLDDPGLVDGTQMRARGVVVVTPPWNFPYAIPAGGCLAALMAGNAVILKPSRESVLTAWMLANQFWTAGVPKSVLQFLPIGDRVAGRKLITDPRAAAVILTGSYETAQNFRTWRPGLPLFAETSGKNSMIITVFADLDLAVKDLVRGAFGHSGQKCSATSLALVEKGVYESPKFRQQLKDAAESLVVGPSWDPTATATPVIREPDANLKQGLVQLDEGESWLLEPRMIDQNPCLWSPGIRMGVKPGSWYHRTECFGPVLGIICVESFQQALEIQNSNEFGLTGGLHSLNPDEIETWRNTVEVGNAYINRTTTGAIVRRQPFGGWKHSVVGPGSKAGGPNYVATMVHWSPSGSPKTRLSLNENLTRTFEHLSKLLPPGDGVKTSGELLRAAVESYHYWWRNYFSREHDPSQVYGETNHFRYRPRPWHALRFEHQAAGSGDGQLPADNTTVLLQAMLSWFACQFTGVPLSISSNSNCAWRGDFESATGQRVLLETKAEFLERLSQMRDGTIRCLGKSSECYTPSEIGNTHVYYGESLANGRLELLAYLREQSMSQTVHRYGNIV